MWTNLQCYAILTIPNSITNVKGFTVKQVKYEFLNLSNTLFNTNNYEGLVEMIRNCYDIEEFEIYWTILDPDHFCEIHNLKI